MVQDRSNISKDEPVHVPCRVRKQLSDRGFDVDSYGVVRWRPESRTHPRQWPLKRKAYVSALICFLEFFMTMVSNTGSNVSMCAMSKLGVGRELAVFCFVTVYLLGQAVGGSIFPPVAEAFGGRMIYVSTTFGFALACFVTAVSGSLWSIVAGRFLAGFFAAVPCVVAAGSIENMWDVRARIFLIHGWIASAVLGLASGPAIATYISTSRLEWPWVYGFASIITAIASLLCFGMHESRPSLVLQQSVRTISEKTSFDSLSTASEESVPTLAVFARTSLWQPLKLFLTEPIVFVVSIMGATVYAVIYMFSEALSLVYVSGEHSYGWSARQGSLVFFAIGIGAVLSILPRFYDVKVANERRSQYAHIEPEDKLFGFYVAAPVLAAGLWWFACSIPPLIEGVSPWVSIASLLFIGYGVVEFDNVLSGYLTDTYASFAASANAPMSFLRAILSGVFPLFGRQFFMKVGSNNAVFVLAAIATAFCGVAGLFRIYGRQIRGRSGFAEKTWLSAQSGGHGLVTELDAEAAARNGPW
ncbi:MFS multidrug transporter [Teratosphaeria nubilosa]|uniref:MFS multidrug transporter n=1 Tax=Teratosphaeria nubilosa TaxID=161662 RepID=A0A6G1LNB6_9PEZI|nr:MFS multidrug transporter [Teratosphaeria nubilosa]